MSDPCNEYQIAPNLFYLRQKQALEHPTAALHDRRAQCGAAPTASTDRARIAELEETTAMKNRIITEVSEALRPILQRLGLAHAKFARWTASIDVHDARCRRRRGEFFIGLSRARSGGAAGRRGGGAAGRAPAECKLQGGMLIPKRSHPNSGATIQCCLRRANRGTPLVRALST